MTGGWRSEKELSLSFSLSHAFPPLDNFFQVVFLATPLSAIVPPFFLLPSFSPQRKHNLISTVSSESGAAKLKL